MRSEMTWLMGDDSEVRNSRLTWLEMIVDSTVAMETEAFGQLSRLR